MGQGFPKNLKRLREKNKLTEEQLAAFVTELGTPLSKAQITSYEAGKTQPTALAALNLAKILDTSVEYLFEERKKREVKPKSGRRPPKKELSPLQLYFKQRDREKKKKERKLL